MCFRNDENYSLCMYITFRFLVNLTTGKNKTEGNSLEDFVSLQDMSRLKMM